MFALLIFYFSFEHYNSKPSLGVAHFILAVILFLYSIANFLILKLWGLYIHKILFFPIVYISFGIFYEYTALGYIKGWAPLSPEEATAHTTKYAIVISLIIMAGVFSVFYKPSKASA